MVKNKDKPWHKRLYAKVTALAAAVCMMLLPATAHADMQGVDMSNWQCGADVYNMQADFIVVGTTWGTGQVNNNCLVSGVNTDANRMIAQAQASGKRFGLYHYAMGGNPEAEARFFYTNTSNYWRHGIVALDWEMDDNPAWGDWDWVRRFLSECERLSGGVRPLLYTGRWPAHPAGHPRPVRFVDRPVREHEPTGYQANPWMIGAYGEAMRQYSGTGVVNTWSPIDLNIFRGEAWQWDLYANPPQLHAPGHTGRARHSRTLPRPTPTRVASATPCSGARPSGTRRSYNAWPLSAWHTPSGDINRYYVGDVVTYGGGSTATPAPSTGVSKVLQWGDTVWDFATAHGYSVSQCSVPSGNINVYYVGDTVTCR